LNPVVIDLAVRLDAFADMVGRMLGSLFTVKLDVQAKSPLVEVDAAQLETALLNAVVNARDAMPGGGELVLTVFDCTFDGKAAVCITVQDSGCGIPEELLRRVFDPFFTTKEIGKGTGLGLSQIHGFAAQAGGAAEIESGQSGGTTLKILLPRTNKALAAPAADERATKLPPGLKVLLVEDNAQVRQFAAELLADLSCEVETAENGSEGLEKALAGEWDLVFSDVVMPGLSGVQLAQAIGEQQPGLPVLLATGFSDELLGENSRRFQVVRKPYDVAMLADAIAKALEAHCQAA
jgi:CheY-like chemotaxis protein